MNFDIKTIFNWKNLSFLGKNKFIKSFYIYLIIVPIAAKLLYFAKNKLNISILSLDELLPFSWIMFFFAALFFTIANLLYSFFAPRIIFENDNFHDFQIKKFIEDHLKKYALNIEFKVYNRNEDDNSSNTTYEYVILKKRIIVDAWTKIATKKSKSKDEVFSDIFYFLYEHANTYRIRMILIISSLYVLGITLFLIIFISQLSYVIGKI